MTVTQYLDLAYAVVVEERVKGGMTLFDALEDTKEWAAGGGGLTAAASAANTTTQTRASAPPSEELPSGVGGPGAPLTRAELANQEAMAVLAAAMSGTDGGFR